MVAGQDTSAGIQDKQHRVAALQHAGRQACGARLDAAL